MTIENALLPRVWELERSLGQAVRVNDALRKTIERQAAQIVLLRDAVGSWLNNHTSENHDAVYQAFSATDDLSGYILCEREPVSSILQASGNPLPLYRAKEQGK